MEISKGEPTRADGVTPSGTGLQQSASDALWYGLGVLWNWRRFIMGITALAAIAAIIIALMLPKWYAAEARVLRSEGGMSLLGMVDRASGGLSRLLGGGGGGDYVRFLAILTSRTTMEKVVEEFDLVRVYEVEDDPHPVVTATEILADNAEFDVDLKYDYLAVRAYDTDPERAAAMANFMVKTLNEENLRLSSQSARESRTAIEQRLRRAETDLDSVRSQIQAFQERHGVVELEAQAGAFMESVASLRAAVAQAEIQYQTLVRQYGPDNPRVQAARSAVQAARAEMQGTLGGSDVLLPIAMRDLPAVSRRYAELLQNQLIQAQIIETIYPLYEQALFQEHSAASAVQVIDAATPPIMAARPSRRAIVVGITLTALILACAFALLYSWMQRNYSMLSQRLYKAAQA